MRRDMAQVIIERPRHSPQAPKARVLRVLEDNPRSEGMRRPHVLHRRSKDFSDLLGPLKRYLRKQVGRPWNKVYSDICEHLRAGKPVDDHVKRHVEDFVAFHVIMKAEGRPAISSLVAEALRFGSDFTCTLAVVSFASTRHIEITEAPDAGRSIAEPHRLRD